MSVETTLLPVKIEVEPPRPPYRANSWIPLRVQIFNPSEHDSSVHLNHIECYRTGDSKRIGVEIDADLFQRHVAIEPGESYCLTLPIKVDEPQTFDVSALAFFFEEDEDNAYRSSRKDLQVQPSPPDEVRVTVEPICLYEEGIKIIVAIEHVGITEFDDVSLMFGSFEAIHAGKPEVRIPKFRRGDRQRLEMVFDDERLEVACYCKTQGERIEDHWSVPIPEFESKEGALFRFLEPRRLAKDRVEIWPEGNTQEPLSAPQGAFTLSGGQTYEIRIVPRDPGVDLVELNDIPDLIHVLSRRQDEEGQGWTFRVRTVADRGLFTRSERLFYTTQGQDGPSHGEVFIKLRPPRFKYWRVALALGLTLTAQGLFAIGRYAVDVDFDVIEAIAEFSVRQRYPTLFIGCIPAIWLGLQVVDRLQYNWGE